MAEIETKSIAADGTPIVEIKVIDKESGTETPVHVKTCTQAVTCSRGIPMEQHLVNLYGHSEDPELHLAAGEKAELETRAGAQAKADAAKNAAVTAASLLIEAAKVSAAEDAAAKANAARCAAYRYTDDVGNILVNHKNDNSNPHGVTAAQVGLGNVPNKATNDLTPTYTESSALENLKSGERLAIAFGKIAKAISSLISHLTNKSNPHSVTASQVGAVPSTGGTMSGNLTMNGGHIVLKEGVNYGTELPEPGIPGRVFFKVVE